MKHPEFRDASCHHPTTNPGGGLAEAQLLETAPYREQLAGHCCRVTTVIACVVGYLPVHSSVNMRDKDVGEWATFFTVSYREGNVT